MDKKRLNRSFARRIGKSLSVKQQNIMDEILDDYLLKPEQISNAIAEIGIGMGEHFINQAKTNSDILHIGFEPYLNGIANSLIMAKEENIRNIRLWPDDMDLVFNKLPNKSLEKIYVLFPDPWPKNSQKKRRIICKERLELFSQKLKDSGILYFASDIDDYSNQVETLFLESEYFQFIENSDNLPHKGYIETKYHSKALSDGRKPRFLSAKNIHN